MRPFRLLLSLFTCILALTLLLYAKFPSDQPSQPQAASASSTKQGPIRALFSWTAPSSLFPPSAIISLTDDNSTFFLARPAAFGPELPSKGLSGPLWIGSGFGDDALSHGGIVAGSEGELGCSDMPGWNEGLANMPGQPQLGLDAKRKSLKELPGKASADHEKRAKLEDDANSPLALDLHPTQAEDDGTDDYLRPLADSESPKVSPQKQKPSEHADIQSLQEGAEIAGKVVLLSRGGCGFLEKAKWVQRRGGTALIVGDNIRGGPLITMYARGDTSNITIPALFTSHTTAHLLSSLMPSGGFVQGVTPGTFLKSGDAGKKTKTNGKNKDPSKPDAAPKPLVTKTNSKTTQTSVSRPKDKNPHSKPTSTTDSNKAVDESPGWFRTLLSVFGLGSGKQSSAGGDSRPPSSGHLDWVLVEDFVDETPKKTTTAPNVGAKPPKPSPHASDDFVIGVQDWRDPDLLPQQTGIAQNQFNDQKQKPDANKGPLKGGSILPGSGEYEKPTNDVVDVSATSKSSNGGRSDGGDGRESRSWLSPLKWGRHADGSRSSKRRDDLTEHPNFQSFKEDAQTNDIFDGPTGNAPHHDGLWVTLTPTTMSSSPFFDTLLVLVVSPLVTLTVVYALLLLRSRIRRRRWRAPKSVVDRLPVRTYHTLPSDSSSPAATPVSSSPTTPLLSQHPPQRPTSSRSRPRSRTTSEVPAQTSSSFHGRHNPRSPSPETEKREAGLAEWRRRYGGRQKECVVCLEEYVDGVSRVMSLPCGHEFHVECITPWLTTRRRTCPICKGDVVRSLQRTAGGSSRRPLSRSSTSTSSSASPSPIRRAAAASPPHPDLGLGLALGHSHEESDDEDIQDEALLRRNDEPDAALPISGEDDYDVERADARRRGADGLAGTVWGMVGDAWRRVGVASSEWWNGRGRGEYDRDR